MDSAKSQLIERLKTARSVLVTVSSNPSVDQLAACIGLTLLVNKIGNHGSAVFSGEVPSTIEFLKPEETLEKTADSLRDFIISLDKSKADKLRYKVEDQVVKIFITPYRTTLSQNDLEFSQGDFNVELVVALGVKDQGDLDQAIVAHGRILHDATVACINTTEQGNLGSINWQEATSSSLCELIANLADNLGAQLMDEQIATCLLTGIIAETNRFSNEKTTSQTMSVSAKLMTAGANQQLVATNLSEEPAPRAAEEEAPPPPPENVDGTLNVEHEEEEKPAASAETPSDAPTLTFAEERNDLNLVKDQADKGSELAPPPDILPSPIIKDMKSEYPSKAAHTVEPLSPSSSFTPPPPEWTAPPVPEPPAETQNPGAPNTGDKTLSEIEKDVNSPHQTQSIDEARERVEALVVDSGPDQALGAAPLGAPLHEPTIIKPHQEGQNSQKSLGNTGLDPSLFSEVPTDKSAPPVPPPLTFPMDRPAGSDNPMGPL